MDFAQRKTEVIEVDKTILSNAIIMEQMCGQCGSMRNKGIIGALLYLVHWK
jgi:hypothetical protein